MGRILMVCTGNQCRSPMAEVLLRSVLPPDSGIEVDSAGTVGDGTPPPPLSEKVMSDIGLSLRGRPSRPLTPQVLAGSDLVVGMARDHLVAAATLYPAGLDRMFTLTDILERGRRAGGRQRSESLADWAARMSAGRPRHTILHLPAAGDIPDPIGGEPPEFEQVRDQLAAATRELAELVVPSGRATAEGPAPRRWWRSR